MGVDGPVQLRVENNPQQRSVADALPGRNRVGDLDDGGWITTLPTDLDEDIVGPATEDDRSTVTGNARARRDGEIDEFLTGL